MVNRNEAVVAGVGIPSVRDEEGLLEVAAGEERRPRRRLVELVAEAEDRAEGLLEVATHRLRERARLGDEHRVAVDAAVAARCDVLDFEILARDVVEDLHCDARLPLSHRQERVGAARRGCDGTGSALRIR